MTATNAGVKNTLCAVAMLANAPSMPQIFHLGRAGFQASRRSVASMGANMKKNYWLLRFNFGTGLDVKKMSFGHSLREVQRLVDLSNSVAYSESEGRGRKYAFGFMENRKHA